VAYSAAQTGLSRHPEVPVTKLRGAAN